MINFNVATVTMFSQEKIPCSHIDFKSIKTGLLRHLVFREFSSHQCSWCLRTFTIKSDLEEQRKICQSVGQPGGSASICSKTFELFFKCDLELHRKKITNIDGSYKFACRFCKQVLCVLSKWYSIRADHKVRGVQCEKCGLNLQGRKALINHLETHIDGKSRTNRVVDKYKCDLGHAEITMKKSLDAACWDMAILSIFARIAT